MIERWCPSGHVHVKERFSNPDIELLAVRMHPYYLPQEFTSVIVITVYILPSDDAVVADEIINSTVAMAQTQHPNALQLSLGILIMLHWRKHYHLLTNIVTATLETIKPWIFCMQMLMMQTMPQPFPLWQI